MAKAKLGVGKVRPHATKTLLAAASIALSANIAVANEPTSSSWTTTTATVNSASIGYMTRVGQMILKRATWVGLLARFLPRSDERLQAALVEQARALSIQAAALERVVKVMERRMDLQTQLVSTARQGEVDSLRRVVEVQQRQMKHLYDVIRKLELERFARRQNQKLDTPSAVQKELRAVPVVPAPCLEFKWSSEGAPACIR
jgi:hypothetical protein